MGGRCKMRLATLALVAVLFTVPAIASVAASVPGVDEAPWGVWRTDTVATGGVTETDIAFTPGGDVRVFFDQGFFGVVVARPSSVGLSWETSRIEQQASTGGLAVAEDGTEWAGYRKTFSTTKAGEVRVAHRADSTASWTVEVVGTGTGPDLALGPEDGVHVVFDRVRESGPDRIFYAHRTGPDTFETEQVAEATVEDVDDPAMTVDDQGRVHTVFVDQHDGDWTQRYAVRDASGSWSFAWLDACTSNPADIAVDLLDQAHVVCHAPGTGLGHYEQTADGWSFEAAATGSDVIPPRGSGGVGFEPGIAIDDAGVVHATFRTGFNGFFPDDPTQPAQLYYAAQDASSGAWSVEPVDIRGTGVGFGSSVAVDEDGRPELAYLVRWRVNALGCRGPLDACFDLDHAEPVPATATGALG